MFILTAVSQEEFDEAIATLTAMYDMLSMQMMGVVGDVDAVTTAVAELQSHTVKRCMYFSINYGEGSTVTNLTSDSPRFTFGSLTQGNYKASLFIFSEPILLLLVL